MFQEFWDCLIIGRGAISLASLCETRLDQSYHFFSLLLVKEIKRRLTELCAGHMHRWLEDGFIAC